MRYLTCAGTLVAFFALSLTSMAQIEDSPAIVNLMINTDMPLSSSEEQKVEAEQQLLDLYLAIKERDLIGTFFIPQAFLDSHARLRLTDIGRTTNFELAMSGNETGEKLSSKSLDGQKKILKQSKAYVEACRICGVNEIFVKGFMPQSFDQNEDTYKVLDDLGIEYNAGFQAGLLYAPGNEDKTWPYPVKGHDFYAVPVSTYDLSGNKVVLQDRYFKDEGIGADQWYNALTSKFDDIQGKDEPLIVSLTTSVSGSGDYLDQLKKFMDYAISRDAVFVTTSQIVEMEKLGVRDVSELPEINESGECLTCNQDEGNKDMGITLYQNNSTQTAGQNETAPK